MYNNISFCLTNRWQISFHNISGKPTKATWSLLLKYVLFIHLLFREWLEEKLMDTKKSAEETETSYKVDLEHWQQQAEQTKRQATDLAESVSNAYMNIPLQIYFCVKFILYYMFPKTSTMSLCF